MKVPKDTASISAELKGICYAEERYCNSFSPTDKGMVEHFWNSPETYVSPLIRMEMKLGIIRRKHDV